MLHTQNSFFARGWGRRQNDPSSLSPTPLPPTHPPKKKKKKENKNGCYVIHPVCRDTVQVTSAIVCLAAGIKLGVIFWVLNHLLVAPRDITSVNEQDSNNNNNNNKKASG